jgi:uncharacterized iron-regulated membrane protein
MRAGGLWVVGIAGMAMLVALLSGVITHRRIFKDFFTFRARKGQRSWLDAHNAVAVLTLPFQIMIAYTGIAISARHSCRPALRPISARAARAALYVVALNESDRPERSGRSMAVPTWSRLLGAVRR